MTKIHHTPFEEVVIKEIMKGKINKEIAYDLNISRHSASVHISNLKKKYQARSRTELALKLVKEGYEILC